MLFLVCGININLIINLRIVGVYYTYNCKCITVNTLLLMLIDKLMAFLTEFCFIYLARQWNIR